MSELDALSWADDVPFDPDDVTVGGRGRLTLSEFSLLHWRDALANEIGFRALEQDPAAIMRWLGVRDRTNSVMDGDHLSVTMMPGVERWISACQALPPSPPLLHSALAAKKWRDISPAGRGDRLASLLIGDRLGPGRWKGSTGGLIALGLKQLQAPWRNAKDSEIGRIWLQAIAAGAHHHLDLETALRAYAVRVSHQLKQRHRSDSLKQLLFFAMGRPSVSSSSVATALKMTSAGAIKLLNTAEGLGLLMERTGLSSFRSYSIPVEGVRAPSPTLTPFEPDFWEITTEN